MAEQNKVWVVDDDRAIRWVLEKSLEKAAMNVRCFSDASELLKMLEKEQPDAIVSDIRMPSMDGFELLKRIQEAYPALPVIIMTAHSDLDSAVSAFHGGAFEYLPKPFDVNEAVAVIERACNFGRSQREEKSEPAEELAEPVQEIIGEAPSMQEVFRAIGRLARSHITVLINGESGTGKELVAQALHRHSPRVKQPFIALNMAA
ncbi:MAG: nitrogen regulation protein NR(I), partial [Gammaproteobacteria bacterium]